PGPKTISITMQAHVCAYHLVSSHRHTTANIANAIRKPTFAANMCRDLFMMSPTTDRGLRLFGGFAGGGGCRRGFGRTRGRAITLYIVGVPGEVALEAVLDVRRSGEAVKFTRIDDELRGAAEAL